MLKLFTLLTLGLASSLCLGAPAEERVSSDDPASQDPRFSDLNYYVNEDDPFTPGTEGDSDLGEQRILRPPEKRGRIHATAEGFLYWSNNVANTEDGEEEGWAVGGRVGLRWRQRLADTLLLDTYAYQDVYRYDSDDLDYESTEFGIGLVKVIPQFADLVAFARYEFLYIRADNPMIDPTDLRDNLHTRLHRVRAGLGKSLFESTNHSIYAGVNARYDIDADPGRIKRLQYSARTSWSYRITDRLRSTAYYQLSFRDYQNSTRQDWHHSAGLELAYSLSNWAKIYASSYYSVNDSNKSDRSYEALEAGVVAGVTAKF